MKKLLITLLAISLVAGICNAQTTPGLIGFAGARYDDGLVLSYGLEIPISGNLSAINYVDWGKYGSVNAEVAFTMKPFAGTYIKLLAGPDATWIDPQDNPVVYLVGAAGAVVAKDFSSKVGGWFYGKYKFKFDNGAGFQNGSDFGAGLFYRF